MIKSFKIDLELFQKQVNLKNNFKNYLIFYGTIAGILIVFKYLTTLPPNTFPLKELFALGIAFLGGFKIQTDSISIKQMQMITFFPFVGVETIKKYFLYKRAVIIYAMIFYLLFPINLSREEILSFFFFLSVIMVMMFIDTLSRKIFPNTEIPDKIYVFLRIAYFVVFAGYLFVDLWGFDLKTFIMNQDLWYLVLIGVSFSVINPFILTLPNRKENEDD